MSDEINKNINNEPAEVEEQPTGAKRGRKPAEKKEFTTADIQAVLQTPEAQAVMQSMVAQMQKAQWYLSARNSVKFKGGEAQGNTPKASS